MDDSKPRQTRRRLDEQAWRAVLGRFDGAAMTERRTGTAYRTKSLCKLRSRGPNREAESMAHMRVRSLPDSFKTVLPARQVPKLPQVPRQPNLLVTTSNRCRRSYPRPMSPQPSPRQPLEF